jgi:heterodisulfide reductase subunit D
MSFLKFLKNIGKNTLYYPGCMTKFVLKSEMNNYKQILTKISIDFITIPEEMCCGSPVLNAGYKQDAINLAARNLEIFKKYNIKKIITNCPACFKFLGKDYKELNENWDIEVEHTVTTILKYLRKKNIRIPIKEKITYHDPCHLGRHSQMYDEPREILQRLGYQVIEMRNNKQDSLCCGGGGGLKANNPELANKIAKQRIDQAKKLGINKIITSCPLCFSNLLENSDIQVEEFSYFVAQALELKPEKTNIKSLSDTKAGACT